MLGEMLESFHCLIYTWETKELGICCCHVWLVPATLLLNNQISDRGV